MKSLKKYVPIALLIASLGLGFNVGCKPKQEVQKDTRKVVIRKDSDSFSIINGKSYRLSNVVYEEYANKSFEINARVNHDIKVGYYGGTDVEGKFDSELLNIIRNPDSQKPDERIAIFATKNNHSEFQVVSVILSPKFGESLHINEWTKDQEKKEYFLKFGEEKLELYKKLFKIEEKKKQSKGKNLYYLLDKFDINDLTLKDFKHEFSDEYRAGPFRIEKKPESLLIDKDNYHLWIYDFDRNLNQDGKADYISLNGTEFERKKDGTYNYIKELYTEEQVKQIFRNANQKLEFVNKIIEQIKR